MAVSDNLLYRVEFSVILEVLYEVNRPSSATEIFCTSIL